MLGGRGLDDSKRLSRTLEYSEVHLHGTFLSASQEVVIKAGVTTSFHKRYDLCRRMRIVDV